MIPWRARTLIDPRLPNKFGGSIRTDKWLVFNSIIEEFTGRVIQAASRTAIPKPISNSVMRTS